MLDGESRHAYLTQAPIHRVIFSLAVPTIISMLTTSFYNMADTFFVGQIDTPSIVAVGLVFPVMFVIQAFGFFFGHGSGNYIARELGAMRLGNAERMVQVGVVCSFLFGAFLAGLTLLLLPRLVWWLGSTPAVVGHTQSYLRILLFGAPFFTSSLTMNVQLRFQGYASHAMWGIISGALCNIFLDPVFIFGLNMGVDGAALATVIGQITSFGVLFAMTRRGDVIPVRMKWASPDSRLLREILYGGSPSLSRQGLGCASVVLLNLSAVAYGEAAVAAMSIVNRIMMFVMSMVVGLGQGFQPLCGFCYGAGLYRRMRSAFFFTVKCGALFLLVCSVIGLLFHSQIIALFRDDDEVVRIGSVAICWQLVTYPLNVFTMASNMLFQTIRKPWRANLLAASRNGLFFVPLILILPRFFGLLGIEMCQSWSDILAFLISVPFVVQLFSQLSKEKK